MNYEFNWAPIWEYRDLILTGLGFTVMLSAVGLVLSLAVGTLMGTFGASGSRLLRTISTIYVEISRNIPLLIHMYIWYMGFAFLRIPAFWCAVIALTIYSGAYVAEVVRSGINSVRRGQLQAALASGLRPSQAYMLVVYPQAFRMISPSVAGLCSQLIKDSSLASVIAVAELTYQAGAIEGRTFRTFEAYITISILYLILVTGISQMIMLASRRSVRRRVHRRAGQGA